MNIKTAAGEWQRLDGLRAGMLSRLERLSQLSIPWVLPPENYDSRHDQNVSVFQMMGQLMTVPLQVPYYYHRPTSSSSGRPATCARCYRGGACEWMR